MKRTVLLVGGTGMLGYEVARELIKTQSFEVRALVRNLTPNAEKDRAAIHRLSDLGVTLTQGDLQSVETLREATAGAHTVISTVQGGADIIIEGQKNLLRASEENGVQRFIPSDFAVDFTTMDRSQHEFLGQRNESRAAAANSSVQRISIQQGAFTEMLLSPFLSEVNWQTRAIQSWGDGNARCNFTTIGDTAKLVAAVTADDNAPDIVQFSGDTKTYRQVAQIFSDAIGEPFQFQSLGSIAELLQSIADTKASSNNPMDYVARQYQWATQSGVGELKDLQNARYPHITPVTIQEFLQANPLVEQAMQAIKNIR